MQSSKYYQNSFSLYVKMNRQIEFGKAIFMVGNCEQLGNWTLCQNNRLSWTQGNNWRKVFKLKRGQRLEYKYVIGDYQGDNLSKLEWQNGRNRSISADETNQNQVYLNQKWNLQHIRIELLTNLSDNIDEVYILGNTVELGMKISKQIMIKSKLSNIQQNEIRKQKQSWCISFYTDKNKYHLNYYYYAKKNNKIQKIRQPGRYLNLDNDFGKNIIDREQAIQAAGSINIVEFQSFNGFKITKLNSNIFIGPYIKNILDFEVLKQNKIKAILNLQSNSDMRKYGVDWDWIQQTANQNEISAYNFQIVDMNFCDFINKSSEALKLLRKLINSYDCVYIHCTAGIYRSPQLAILYLVIFQDYNLGNAMNFVKEKRPFAHPYVDCLKWALQQVYISLNKAKTQFKQMLCT